MPVLRKGGLPHARVAGPGALWSLLSRTDPRHCWRCVPLPKSIAVFGAGPGLGHAVARRYARDGYEVVLVARRRRPLDLLARALTEAGAKTHVITADLADTDAVPVLAEQIRAAVGDLDALYYAPTPEEGFVPAAG